MTDSPLLERTLWLADADATEAFGRALAANLRSSDVVSLTGALGAGKTTLARGVLAGLGFAGEVASPTFALVHPYEPPDVRLPAWHVDLYRVEAASELRELGLEDVDGLLLVEWPERFPELWPEALRLRLEPERGGRRLTADFPAAWAGRWSI
ncbi:MAG: tRNA (adenosine(37)-N6)-threonylcarbamoyltransferase complex ATPase subunit type 1 TsaE [Sphingosinicella sp.]